MEQVLQAFFGQIFHLFHPQNTRIFGSSATLCETQKRVDEVGVQRRNAMSEKKDRMWYYGTEDDKIAIDLLKERYGLSTDSDAVRFALRLVADPEAIKNTINQKRVKRARPA